MEAAIEGWVLHGFVKLGWGDRLENLVFESPEWLGLILLWPVLWILTWVLSWGLGGRWSKHDDLTERRGHSQLKAKHNLIHLMHSSSTPHRSRPSHILSELGVQLVRGLLIVMLAIALADPTELFPSPSQPQTKTVRDIAFVIESSASFLLPDYEINGQPETRMNVVKQVLDDFISKLDGNRFAITIYADKAYSLLPMTFDQTLTRMSLKRLKPYLAGRNDSAMGEALGLALKQTDSQITFNQIERGAEGERQGRKKVMVLISDGLTLASRLALSEAVNYAQLLGVPIYTIGVGSNTAQADTRSFRGLLYQPLESESLQQIASQTKAHYYQVGSREEIRTVLQQINRAEGVPYTPPPVPPQRKSLAYYPLLLSAIIFGLYGVFSLFFIKQSRARKPNQTQTEGMK